MIGGGDGGVVREVIKHSGVEEVHICEIDERVIEVAKKYLPTMAVGFEHQNVKVHTKDGAEFSAKHHSYFDVIITDSSDPIGKQNSQCKSKRSLVNFHAIDKIIMISVLA